MVQVTEDTTLSDLSDLCARTAIFPAEEAKRYTLTGLVGELGEVCNKLKKVIRDDASRLTPKRADELHSELGDVLWYLMLMFRAWGGEVHGDIRELRIVIPTTGVFDGEKFTSPPIDFLIYCTHYPLTKQSHHLLEQFAGLVFTFNKLPRSDSNAEYPVFTFAAVADRVIQKLAARAERGTLSGDGDKR